MQRHKVATLRIRVKYEDVLLDDVLTMLVRQSMRHSMMHSMRHSMRHSMTVLQTQMAPRCT